MIDILEELALLSNALQSRSTSFQKADRLIRRTIRAMQINLKSGIDKHEKEVPNLIESETYKCI